MSMEKDFQKLANGINEGEQMKKKPIMIMCSPTKYLSKCNDCHRRRAEVKKWQPCTNYYNECKDDKYGMFIEWKKKK